MISAGNTGWLLISSALVLLMTPGVGFFYSGLVPTRSAVNTISMCFICCAVIPVLWVTVGYTLVFSPGNGLIGGLQWFGLAGLEHSNHGTVPAYAFVVFQMMFAVISPALIAGAIVGRARFKPYVLFIALWSLLIYVPVAHWVWGPDGWIARLGALDFAGGAVVHINSGFAALTAAMVLGPRLQSVDTQSSFLDMPHNIPFVVLGTSLLWFGWYGFNAGSALAANDLASLAFITTTLSASMSIVTWTVLSWVRGVPASTVGSATSAIIGLVAITPAAGYVTPMSALLIGGIASVICYFFLAFRFKILQRADDTLDVFICHGVAGLIGAIMTGILATTSVNEAGANGLLHGNPKLLLIQVVSVAAIITTSILGTAVILFVLKMFMSIRPTPEEEQLGMDLTEHAESAYKQS